MTGHSEKKDYRSIAADKQRRRQAQIPEAWLIDVERYCDQTNLLQVPVTCGILDEVEVSITSDHDATAVLDKIARGVWSVERVTVAFCKRAAIAHQLVCSLRIVLS